MSKGRDRGNAYRCHSYKPYIGVLRYMIEYTPIKVLQLVSWPMTPFMNNLPILLWHILGTFAQYNI